MEVFSRLISEIQVLNAWLKDNYGFAGGFVLALHGFYKDTL